MNTIRILAITGHHAHVSFTGDSELPLSVNVSQGLSASSFGHTQTPSFDPD